MAEALGLAAGIAQFSMMGLKFAGIVREVYESTSGIPDEYGEIMSVASDIENITGQLLTQTAHPKYHGDDEQAIYKLAAESNQIAIELKATIKKALDGSRTKSTPLANKSQSGKRLGTALRLFLKEKDIKHLEERMQRIVNEMSLRTTHLMRLQQIETSARNESNIEELKKAVAHLQIDISSLCNASDVATTRKDCQASLVGLVDAFDEIMVKVLIDELRYDEIEDRYDSVSDVHAGSCQWIFDRSKTELMDWLESSNGLFWIQGKAGSGKSTLMKFIKEDTRRKKDNIIPRALAKWSGSKTLVIAQHFFWYGGLKLQRSIEGLYRSLLSQIVEAAPDVIKHIHVNLGNCRGPWSRARLRAMLEDIGTLDESLGFRFFLMIDGLDEYENRDADFKSDLDIIDLVKRLSISPCMKILVSSRHWTPFQTAFNKTPQLLTEVFTRSDMEKFAWEQLESAIPSTEKEMGREDQWRELAEEIAAIAEGVWLWTCLVVLDMKRKIMLDEGFSKAKEALDKFPRGLEDYFGHIVASTTPDYRVEGARILLLAVAAESINQPFQLDSVCLILQMDEAPSKSLPWRERARQARLPPWFKPPVRKYNLFDERPDNPYKTKSDDSRITFKLDEDLHYYQIVRNRLNNRTKDLLELEWPGVNKMKVSTCTYYRRNMNRIDDAMDIFELRVAYLHRTVRDFLTQYHFQELQENAGEKYHPHLVLLRAKMLPLVLGRSSLKFVKSKPIAYRHLRQCLEAASAVDTKYVQLFSQPVVAYGVDYDDPLFCKLSFLDVKNLERVRSESSLGDMLDQYEDIILTMKLLVSDRCPEILVPMGPHCNRRYSDLLPGNPQTDKHDSDGIIDCSQLLDIVGLPELAFAVVAGLHLFVSSISQKYWPQRHPSERLSQLLCWYITWYRAMVTEVPTCCYKGMHDPRCKCKCHYSYFGMKRSSFPFNELHSRESVLEMMEFLLKIGAQPCQEVGIFSFKNYPPSLTVWDQFLRLEKLIADGANDPKAKGHVSREDIAVLLMRYGASPDDSAFGVLFMDTEGMKLQDRAKREGVIRGDPSKWTTPGTGSSCLIC
ncbi:hypothetical protein BJ508DRAFT_415950 [Ascobolus immersus RN42]|uniref:NACHT domain-containing protein n=1 Tax=Ascobolus immersus RN42 TaxID=1160509 RepID=A0A3N4I1N7_ASCIM|nr:hypothetical protein BJ508DRAFT_415950 [Ascobolus immersus RN42]